VTYNAKTKEYTSIQDVFVFQLRDPFYKYCSATGAGLKTAMAGVVSKFYIQCQDVFGDPADNARFSVLISGNVDMTPTPFSVGTGLYQCEYTPVKVGTYTVNIKVGRGGAQDLIAGVDDNPDNDDHEFSLGTSVGTPGTLAVAPGPTSPPGSVAEGEFLTLSTAGVAAGFTITAQDQFGNRRPGGDSISALMQLWDQSIDKPVSDVDPNTGSVTDNSDGSYAVSYSITRAGMYQLDIQFAGNGGAGSPYALLVSSGPADIEMTYVYGQLLTVNAGSPSLIYVQTRDGFGNNIIADPTEFPFGTENIEFELCLSVPKENFKSPDTCGGGEEELGVGIEVFYSVGPDGEQNNTKTGTPYYGLYMIQLNPFNSNEYVPRVSKVSVYIHAYVWIHTNTHIRAGHLTYFKRKKSLAKVFLLQFELFDALHWTANSKKTCVLLQKTRMLLQKTCVLLQKTCVLLQKTRVLLRKTCVLLQKTCVLLHTLPCKHAS
jgi:hypothetical protein